MRFDLIAFAPEIRGGYFAELHDGPSQAPRWSEGSFYLDGDVFEALVFVVDAFTLKGPVTLQGGAVERLADDLAEAARRVSHADSPKAIWPYSAGYGYTQFNAVRDWPADRQVFNRMLRDLSDWARAAHRSGRSVTIHCV